MKEHHPVEDILSFCRNNWPETHIPAHQYVLYLHRLSEQESTQASLALRQYDLSLTGFDILATLRRSASPHILNPTELQRSTLLSSGGQTKALYQLEEQGLVKRSVCDEDRRSKLVHLTRKGKSTIEKAMAETLQQLETSVRAAGMSDRELGTLIRLLGKLSQGIENAAQDDRNSQGACATDA